MVSGWPCEAWGRGKVSIFGKGWAVQQSGLARSRVECSRSSSSRETHYRAHAT